VIVAWSPSGGCVYFIGCVGDKNEGKGNAAEGQGNAAEMGV